ncbi:MAG: TlpA disulfide reductase family protein [Rikenellaceae bacterium]
MRAGVLSLLLVVLAISCTTNKTHVEGVIICPDNEWIFLEKINGLERELIDSVQLDESGRFLFKIAQPTEDPTLYELSSGREGIPLFVAEGDRVIVNSIGRLAHNYNVSGSRESELLREFFQPYVANKNSLAEIAREYASEKISDEEREKIAKRYSDIYRTTKRDQLKFIIANNSSLAAVYALFQHLPGDKHLFNGTSDIIYMRNLAEALEQSYPNSSYLRGLKSQITKLEQIHDLESRVELRTYPELNMENMYGEKISLSSLDGKVILLSFVSVGAGNSDNASLGDIYKRYADKGFEIYQVSIESSRSRWIEAVQAQRLPWISVSDLRGSASPSLGLYNVTHLPSYYLIGKDGQIEGINISFAEIEPMVKSQLNR